MNTVIMKGINKDKEMPLVSVGVPTYNRVEKLSKALCSLGKQTYKNLEIIVSDNCSTEGNVEGVMETCCQLDSRITFYRQKTNIGATNNFETVRDMATGEFFLWLADDDALCDDYIKECVQYLVDNPEFVLVAGCAKFYRPDDSYYEGEAISLQENVPQDRMVKYYQIVAGNSVFYGVYRTEIIQRIKIHNILAGDWLMIGEVALLGKIQTLKNIFIHREASHLFLHDPWERLFSYYKLPMWGKRFPQIWIALELKNGIKHSKIVAKCFDGKKMSWKVFRLILVKFRNMISLTKIPYFFAAIIFYPIICNRRAKEQDLNPSIRL